MTYNVYFNFCALANFVIILGTCYIKKNITSEQNKYFKLALWCAFLAAIFDMIQALGSNGMDIDQWKIVLSSYGYFIVHNATPFLYLLYVISFVSVNVKSSKWWKKILLFGPIILSMLTILSTPLTKAAFYFDENQIYHRGNYQIILYVVSFYYMIYGMFYIIRSGAQVKLISRIALCDFYVLSCVAVLVQGQFPHLLIENFAVSICFFLSYLTIQKPEEMLDATANVFSRSIFTSILKSKLLNKEKFLVVVVHLDHMELFQKALGVENVQNIIRIVAKFLEESNKEIYYLQDNAYGIISPKKNIESINEIVENIIGRFEHSWDFNDMSIMLMARACIIRCPEDTGTVDSLYECVDEFIHEKRGDQLITLAKNMDLQGRKRISEVEEAVSKALKEGKLQVYYQPIYNVKDRRFSSAEALVRLWDDKLGFIPPDEFISIAEKNGQILQIGTCVFEFVCRFIKENNLNVLGLNDIHVNLSIVQCMQDDLAAQLLSLINLNKINAGSVKLEVTETAASNFPEILHKNMEILLKNGVHFALDDFGTGYSNFNSIASLPIDTIKLDKSLIFETNINERAKIVLESSVAMIKKMKMGIIAEGVETAEQRDTLINLGCDSLQGYYFSRPVCEEEFLEFLHRNNIVTT